MVLGLVSLAATIPMTATSVLSLQDQAERTNEKDSGGGTAAWMRNKAHIKTRATKRTPDDRKRLFQNSHVVLRDGLLYVQSECQQRALHPFTGYFVPYPDAGYEGIVSTISKYPPQLNWVYIDRSTWQVRHGLRAEAERGITGPWGVSVMDGERHVLWGDWEGFLAVETDEQGLWALYFDRENNGLRGRFGGDRRIVEIELLFLEVDEAGKA